MDNKIQTLEPDKMMYYTRELIELKTPPSTNVILYTILIFFFLLFTSLFTIKINDVIKVPGIVRSRENASEVKNVISGTITSINYKPNQLVHKGDVLLSIDDSQYNATKEILTQDLQNVLLDIQLNQTLLEAIKTNKNIQTDDDYIDATISDYFKTLAYYSRQIQILKYEYDYQKSMPETIKNDKSVQETYFQYKLKKDELAKFKNNFYVTALETQKNLSTKENALNQELIKLENQYSHLFIKAPVSGYIQEFSSLNIGDFLESGHLILRIIPIEDKDFKVEMTIPTKDIGEITEGMEVKYGMSAFPFFEYKGAKGYIKSIDPDVRLGNENKLVYCVYSDIDKVSFKNYQGDEFPLRAGIEVDGRIIMRKITIANYLFRKMGFIK